MPNYQDEHNIEDNPKYESNKGDSNQFVSTDELYALDEAYRREAETSQELSAGEFNQPIESTEQESEMKSDVNTAFGWAGLILAIASFFIWPLIMAIGGIILGFVSRRQGAETLGNAAIVVAIISLLISLIFIPMF
ncbi:DUF4190 domain-containing protein [Gracilibacillus sp. YIM 98692]|uniref:DUF4190 domain-containing protein n=1 Tax=Gracilibacillus sp. YIM 98692 TaxID=2663532 RepID=UPI0013D506C5|nr:DUF4190 domain-containing protein [Gracilibacillus sp. YIM 98692]